MALRGLDGDCGGGAVGRVGLGRYCCAALSTQESRGLPKEPARAIPGGGGRMIGEPDEGRSTAGRGT